ncbi:helix-turn-helix domain-containing protein [Paraburkholderia sp.]|uniref:GlxA family transcriptional regulator n=1 Tax=Paraburkholderia sp. TaxID=1926495 RepID=UPI00238B91EE|nr:helix-turn-helix domain-containing protein [Paraburkholderia sp.]MDE1184257.1 helix-turn-helix domain-containing protein [Paraburkholderia sp.]
MKPDVADRLAIFRTYDTIKGDAMPYIGHDANSFSPPGPGLDGTNTRSRRAARSIGILLLNRFSLMSTGIISELFHSANAIAQKRGAEEPIYHVRFLSPEGGNIACTSAIRVVTDSLDMGRQDRFDALFVAGGEGAFGDIGGGAGSVTSGVRAGDGAGERVDGGHVAPHDERVLDWLRQVRHTAGTIHPIGDSWTVLAAAGIELRPKTTAAMSHGATYPASRNALVDDGDPCAASDAREPRTGRRNASVAGSAMEGGIDDRHESIESALVLIKRDLGLDVARDVAAHLLPGVSPRLMRRLSGGGAMSIAEKINAAAQWIEEHCDGPLSVTDAAHAAAMSERNFLRHFKHELGVTPSDYLQQMRLKLACEFLADTDLPVDKIARRCGAGNGHGLAKSFRRVMGVSPTEYRLNIRAGEAVVAS